MSSVMHPTAARFSLPATMARSASGTLRPVANSKSFPHDGRVHLLAVSADGTHLATAVQGQCEGFGVGHCDGRPAATVARQR